MQQLTEGGRLPAVASCTEKLKIPLRIAPAECERDDVVEFKVLLPPALHAPAAVTLPNGDLYWLRDGLALATTVEPCLHGLERMSFLELKTTSGPGRVRDSGGEAELSIRERFAPWLDDLSQPTALAWTPPPR